MLAGCRLPNAENVCNLKKQEADWILKIDILEQGDKLEESNSYILGEVFFLWFPNKNKIKKMVSSSPPQPKEIPSDEKWVDNGPRRKAKWCYSTFHTVTSMVGAGVLSLPYAMAYLGCQFSSDCAEEKQKHDPYSNSSGGLDDELNGIVSSHVKSTSQSKDVRCELLRLSLPVIGGQAIEPMVQLMETAYIGRLGNIYV